MATIKTTVTERVTGLRYTGKHTGDPNPRHFFTMGYDMAMYLTKAEIEQWIDELKEALK